MLRSCVTVALVHLKAIIALSNSCLVFFILFEILCEERKTNNLKPLFHMITRLHCFHNHMITRLHCFHIITRLHCFHMITRLHCFHMTRLLESAGILPFSCQERRGDDSPGWRQARPTAVGWLMFRPAQILLVFSIFILHLHGWEIAGMPANRTFLELSAGQSEWPEKNCVVLLPKKRRRPVSFRHEEKRFSLWTAPCLSIENGVYRVTYAIFCLPSLIIL